MRGRAKAAGHGVQHGDGLVALPVVASAVRAGSKRPGLDPGGNSASTFTINQKSTQNNDTGANQTNMVEGDCTTSGSCTVIQQTNVNNDTTNNTQTGSNVDTPITCSSGDTCSTSGSGTSSILTGFPTRFSVSNIDVAEFGVGGMRGTGTGSITVSGITTRVADAFLYWHGPTNSSDPASNASVTFAGSRSRERTSASRVTTTGASTTARPIGKT